MPQSRSFIRSVALATSAFVEGVAALVAGGCDYRGDIIVNRNRLIGLGDHSLTCPIPIQIVGIINGSVRIALAGKGRCQLPPVLPGEVPAGIPVKVADGVAALHRAADCAGIWVEGLTLVGNALSVDGCQKIRPAGIVIGVCNLLIVPILAPGILGKNIACCIIGIMEGCGPVFVNCLGQLALGVIGIGG